MGFLKNNKDFIINIRDAYFKNFDHEKRILKLFFVVIPFFVMFILYLQEEMNK